MLRATLRSLRAHRIRLALSALSVILGVAFVAGSLVYTDTLEKTFDQLFETISADVTVAPQTSFDVGLGHGGSRPAAETGVPASLLDDIRAVDGVAAAEGDVSSEGVYVLDDAGEPVSAGGAPGIGVAYSDTPGLSPLSLVDGRAPAGEGEIVIDTSTADRAGLGVGDHTRVLTPSGTHPAEVVGEVRVGDSSGLMGATLVAFDRDTAQRLFGDPGYYTTVSVRADEGVSDAVLADRVAAALPDGYDALTQAEQADDSSAELDAGLGFLNTLLLVFAGIAVFVGSFIILNTFSMLVAQRTRELALLRAIGASRRQVTRSVLVEALAVGVLGATVGLLAGIGVAALLRAMFGRFGLELDGALVVSGTTVAWSYAIGVVVTLIAAYVPARRAGTVPPVAAMRDEVALPERSLRLRAALAVALAAAGTAALAGGLASGDGSTAASLVGVGALLLILAGIAGSPALSRPVVRVVAGWYPRVFGAVGRLAGQNARRNPRRTAATASALMVGLALVGSMSVLGASVKASLDRLVEATLGADYVLTTETATPFSTQVADRAREVPGVASVSARRLGQAQVDGQTVSLSAVDPATIGDVLTIDITEGSLDGLHHDGLLVDTDAAADHGWRVGDTVPVTFPYEGTRELRLGGTYQPNEALGSYFVSLDTFTAAGYAAQDNVLYVDVAAGTDPETVRPGLQRVVDDYPVVDLADQAQFKEDQQARVDQLLVLIYALLALAIVIAVLGIVNTLALSVIERTREIGLLRAVGMTRPQLRRMVRLESVAIAVFGAVLGLALGVVFGAALQASLADQGIEVLEIPAGRLAIFLLLAALVGVLAAVWPARRASRLDVLRAITVE